jgi:colanic acid/amylovoran biosynthesis protein
MSQLTIEIHGTGVHNRGAELMALAIAERMRTRFPECRIVVSPEFGSMQTIYAHGFLMSSEFSHHFVNRLWWRLAPPNLRRKIGLVSPSEVDIVLDASGFSFSDKWGPDGAKRLTEKMNSPVRRRQPLVLLPQAFGPFQSSVVADAVRHLLQRAKLVCARDQESLHYLQNLGTPTELHLFPDFTFSIAAKTAEIPLPERPFVAIVPNARMLDKTSVADSYLEFLATLPRLLFERGLSPIVVLHDAYEDVAVLNQIAPAFRDVPRVSHADPRVLKWVLGRASFVIGSRYHALVSALSQGTPCIGAGWSHKYAELFSDFDCDDALLRDLADLDQIRTLVDEFSDPNMLQRRRKPILERAAILRKESETLWRLVDDIIESQLDNQ